MPTEIDQFSSLFSCEHELQIALVDLFSKIPGTTRVQILQGSLEHGKDIVFRRELLPGRPVLIACVVKNHPIDGSSYESRKSAATVMNQVRQALKNPFRDSDGTLIPVHQVYVITPYQITREAILSIEGELIELQGRFEFLAGSHLLDFFREYYPSFITFRGDFFNSYLRALIAQLEPESHLMALSRTEQLLSTVYRTFLQTYVEPRFVAQFTTGKPIPIPKLTLPFNRKLSQHALVHELQNLRRVSSLLLQSEKWAHGDVTANWPRHGIILSNTVKLFSTWWDTEASKYISRGGTVGSYVSRDMIEVAVPASYAPSLDIYQMNATLTDCHAEFTNLVSLASKCWSQIRSNRQTLADVFTLPGLNAALCAEELISSCADLFRETKQIRSFEASQNQLTSRNESFTVTAPPGFGKTTFCKWNAIYDARTLLDGVGTLFPVYVPLHRFNDSDPTSIQLLEPQVKDFLHSQQASEHSVSRVRIYLDGLDEVRARRNRNAVLDAASKGIAIPFDVQFIITSRDSAFNSRMAIYPRFRIAGMTVAEARALVRKLLDGHKDEIDEFWKQVGASGELGDLVKVPLLLRLIVSVFGKTRKLPQNRYRLYQMFLEMLAQGWDRAKNVERGFRYESEVKLRILQSLAGRMHAQGRREAMADEIQASIAASTSAEAIDLSILISEFLHQGLLVQTGTSYLFSHLSFQEYLAARDLNDPSGMRQSRALLRFLNGDDWWKEVISFYINGHSSPTDLELWVSGGINRRLNNGKNDVTQLRGRIENLEKMFATSHPGFNVRLPRP